MNATPATVVRQIATAQRVNRVQPNRLAYSTSTVDAPRVAPERSYPEHTASGYSDECACEKWADCYYCGACTPD